MHNPAAKIILSNARTYQFDNPIVPLQDSLHFFFFFYKCSFIISHSFHCIRFVCFASSLSLSLCPLSYNSVSFSSVFYASFSSKPNMSIIESKFETNPPPKFQKAFLGAQICLRILVTASTLAATWIIITSKQSTQIIGITFDARYSYSPAFK